MGDLSITASAVLQSTAGQVTQGVAGATITQGQALYVDTASNNVLKLADSNAVSPANSIAGIALNGASAGQIVNYCTQDALFMPGTTLVAADVLFLSDTPGGITKTVADVLSSSTLIVLGVCVTGGSATVATVNFKPIVGGIVP